MTFLEHRIAGGIGADDAYWEALEAGQFRLPRCGGCGRWTWPAHWRCGECGSWDFEWVGLEPRGVVYSWTRCWAAFDRTGERAPDVPYVVLLVEVDGAGGARVMGVLEGDGTPRVGARAGGAIRPPAPKSLGYPSLVWTLEGD